MILIPTDPIFWVPRFPLAFPPLDGFIKIYYGIIDLLLHVMAMHWMIRSLFWPTTSVEIRSRTFRIEPMTWGIQVKYYQYEDGSFDRSILPSSQNDSEKGHRSNPYTCNKLTGASRPHRSHYSYLNCCFYIMACSGYLCRLHWQPAGPSTVHLYPISIQCPNGCSKHGKCTLEFEFV